ncbi:MAG: hypothetical protein KGL39_35795 [Patescibacteria group bacterium]|nr:hypothetical protein [Patescibacteria group bacterium]
MAENKTRSLTIDIFAPDDDRQTVLNSIRRYRAACREVYGCLLCAQAAGAHIEYDKEKDQIQVNPSGHAGAAVLAAVRGQVEAVKGQTGEGMLYTVRGGAGLGYDLRQYVLQHLLPSSLSFVWDSLRRDVVKVWTSRDPEFTKARRGWLALQGSRGVAQFNWRGIGIPVSTGRPQLGAHHLLLKWDREIGPVNFDIPTLDRGRYQVLRAIREQDEGWSLGTVFLNEHDGKLRASISYTAPSSTADLDPEAVCRVRFGAGDAFLRIVANGGDKTYDTISDHEVVGMLKMMLLRRQKLELRRAACGNPRRPWGHRKGWLANQDVLSRATLQRERLVQDRNHAWTRRIVSRAISWRCGVIEVGTMPEDLGGEPWKWAQFKTFLEYKASERGIKVQYA